jgi:4-pyridoxolactonase
MPKKTRVALLDGGATFTKEYRVFWNLASEARIRMPSYSVLIEHAEGLFLFDSGFDLTHFETAIAPGSRGAALQTARQTLPGQLELLGLAPDDIDVVLNSHYHFDHCGGNKHCRHAKTICHRCELEQAREPASFEQLVYSDLDFLPEMTADEAESDIHTASFETIQGDQEIAKGITLFETPGHTDGHYSLLVKPGDRRPMIFSGDAAYMQRSIDDMCIASFHVDPRASYRSLERIKQMALEHDAEIFFPHDDALYATYLKAPAWYE